jgi:hypothetical protein
LKELLDSKRIELDDAEYFNKAAPEIARIRQEIALLEQELSGAAESFGGSVRQSLLRTEQDFENRSYFGRYQPNPPRFEELREAAYRALTLAKQHGLRPMYVERAELFYDSGLAALEGHGLGALQDYAHTPGVKEEVAAGKFISSIGEIVTAIRIKHESHSQLGYAPPELLEIMALSDHPDFGDPSGLGSRVSNPRVRRNPLLAIVGMNPGPRGHSFRSSDCTRPWSVANTPVMLNPRLPVAGRIPRGSMVPIETALAEYREVIDAPKPFKFIENGFVIWEGPSPVDGAPLVAIVTGVAASSESGNVKTGAMLQTWILRADISPQEAVDTGQDRSICGDCVHRGFEAEVPGKRKRRVITAAEAARGHGIAGGPRARQEIVDTAFEGRSCYVVVAQAPMAIWKKYKRTDPATGMDRVRPHLPGYPKLSLDELALLGWGRLVRLGSYGDPAMVPVEVWEALTWDSVGWTGYTQGLRRFVMASVDTVEEMQAAHAMDWRTFRVLMGDQQLVAGLEIQCPASQEGGYRKTCDACRACQGAMPGKPRIEGPAEERWREREGGRVPSVAIKVHPRWQILYWPRAKKGKSKLRGHRPDVPSTKSDPRRRPTEILLVDYVAGTQAKEVLKDLRRAEKSKDPESVVERFRHKYPAYLQEHLDHAASVLAGRHKRRNPRAATGPGPHPYGPDWRSCACGRDYDISCDGSEEACADCLFAERAPKRKKKKSTRGRGQRQVAGPDPVGRVKPRSKKRTRKVKKNRATPKGQGKPKAKKKRFSIKEARERFEGVDEAVAAYKKFHGRKPSHVDVYVLEDGKDGVSVERAHAALHRTIDTNYFVPWDSNKKNTLWKHEHVEGYDLFSDKQTPKADKFPLEILDPATGTTRKILGQFSIGKWWYEPGQEADGA